MKMKNAFLAGTFATALLFTACNKNKDDNNNDVNAQDETFILKASQSNRAEIGLGNLALVNGTDSSVKSYAQMMITEHTAAQTLLQNVADNANSDANLNDSLDADQVAMRTMLISLSGRSFDSAYIASQVVSHQKTLALFDAELAGGNNSDVKAYATTNRPGVENHLKMADSLSANFK